MNNIEREYFLSVSNQGVVCATKVFRNYKKDRLYMASVKNNQYLLRSEPFEGSETVWIGQFKGKTVLRFPAQFGFKKSNLILTTVDETTWWIRLANEKEMVFRRRHYKGNIHHECLMLPDEYLRVLKKSDPAFWVECRLFNSLAIGSWLELKAVPAQKFRPGRTYRETDPEILFWNDTTSKEIYLPHTFRALTGIKSDDELPVRRDGDTIIVEGRPGICCKCGRHISRYKQPIANICTECAGDEDMSDELQECLDQLNAIIKTI